VRFVVTAVLILTASASAFLQSSRADLVITRVTVIDAEGTPAAERTVIVRNGTISQIAKVEEDVPDAAVTIDGRGRFLVPGLWDMHVHLSTRPEPQLAERVMLPTFLAYGVVGVRDMGGPLARVLELRDQVNRGALAGPRILTPGPFMDGPGEAEPMFRRATNAAEGREAVRELVKAGVDFVKVQANLTKETYDAIVDEAKSRKVVVAGHVPVALSLADVIRANQRSIEHISPALDGDAGVLFACSSREADLRKELLAIERERATLKPEQVRARDTALRAELVKTFDPERARAIGRQLKGRQIWLVPTLIWSNSLRPLSASDNGADLPLDIVPADARKRWQDNRARYLKSAPPEAFTAASDVARVSGRAIGTLHAAGARILAGTDTFDAFVLPGVSLHQELALLVQAGLPPLAALQSATKDAADYRGSLDREGTIAPKKRADLLLIDANPLTDIANLKQIHAVVQAGRVFDRAELDQLLQSARDAAR
jgi:imidazolonepropionase-like amidohydrolase